LSNQGKLPHLSDLLEHLNFARMTARRLSKIAHSEPAAATAAKYFFQRSKAEFSPTTQRR